MRNLFFLIFEAQLNFRDKLFDSVEAQPNFRNGNFKSQCKFRIFCDFRLKKSKRNKIKFNV